ncbi:MAG: PulJ/GspJ family protein [Candidatus Saccharimonadales bacterium]
MKQITESGFTIVELLVSMIVSVILAGAILGYMANQIAQSTVATAKVALLNQDETGLNRINTDVRLSSNADAANRWPDPYAPTSGNEYSWTSNSTTLILATAAQNSSGAILWQDASEYIPYKNNIIYFVQNNTLYKRILAAQVSGNAVTNTCPAEDATATCPADEVILNNVSSFTVSYLDGNGDSVTPTNARSIVLQISLAATAFHQSITASYSTQMVFRDD